MDSDLELLMVLFTITAAYIFLSFIVSMPAKRQSNAAIARFRFVLILSSPAIVATLTPIVLTTFITSKPSVFQLATILYMATACLSLYFVSKQSIKDNFAVLKMLAGRRPSHLLIALILHMQLLIIFSLATANRADGTTVYIATIISNLFFVMYSFYVLLTYPAKRGA